MVLAIRIHQPVHVYDQKRLVKCGDNFLMVAFSENIQREMAYIYLHLLRFQSVRFIPKIPMVHKSTYMH